MFTYPTVMALDLNKLHDQLDSYIKILLSRDEYKDAQVSSIYKNVSTNLLILCSLYSLTRIA